ncbi:hypothetical protein Ahy_A04g021211 [Arachis hypogaea]|uniref:Uncharacterized protein n=1 Tax=Arachis hypogaea TaxID=3818 RepID=A0A445DJN6_ARAHY|nr:hypothetical protein Ahy_A04g021211 [Arachis hypogaea]
MKGVYDAWKKAAPFTHQSKIVHKGGFLTLEEVKESFREYETLHPEQTLKRADKAPIQAQRTGIMRNIPTRAEIKKRVCRSNLRETLNIVLNWTEEKRTSLGYYPIAKEQPTKLVIFPKASPSDTYQFFQYGLIDTILIFNDLKIISEFPAGFVDAVKRFKNMIDNVNPRDISLKFTNSQPIFSEEEECLVPAHQIQSLKKAIEAMKSTQQAKPSEFGQLSMVDNSSEEKISENKIIAEIIKKST